MFSVIVLVHLWYIYSLALTAPNGKPWTSGCWLIVSLQTFLIAFAFWTLDYMACENDHGKSRLVSYHAFWHVFSAVGCVFLTCAIDLKLQIDSEHHVK
jgi:predicted membrane channel-forming protein YqfA (hemolysin III family)